jgi:hypothetical protein
VGRATIFDELEELTDCPWFIEPKDKDPASEFQRQSTFLATLHRLAPSVDALAIPNAGKSTDWERLRRYREGARRGALDLIITWNRGVMFAEFKDGQKMPTKDQRERLNRYHRMGHHCGVFRKPETLIEHLRQLGAPFVRLVT